MDGIYSFPGLILAIAMAALLGPGMLNVAIAIAVICIPVYFCLVRSSVLGVIHEEYVTAARLVGDGPRDALDPRLQIQDGHSVNPGNDR
jgi:peptide/nickel transport system permease protein